MACIIDCCVPTHSSTESAPTPLVSSMTRATPSSPRSETMSVAPNSRASCCRFSCRLITMIRSAPICLAERTPSRPTAPSPTTTTVDPGLTLAASAANQPVPSTSDVVSRQLVRRNVWRRHQRPVCQRHAQHRRLRPGHELAMDARGLIAVPAVGAGVVGGGKRADDKLPRLERLNRAAHFLDDAAIFVTHRRGPLDRLKAAIGPQVRPAHARGRNSDHRIGRLDDLRSFAVLNADVAGAVENGSFHDLSPYSGLAAKSADTSTIIRSMDGTAISGS